MGKVTGFLDYKRIEQKKRAVKDRIADWKEFRIPQNPEELQIQGARCMNCGVPFCHGGILLNGKAAGCPLHNLIPEWNELVYLGQWEDAYRRLIRTNPFPEVTARVCPAPCEGSCTEGSFIEAVAISNLEYAIIERAFNEGWVKATVSPSTGRRVAIVGSGPAGLSAAYFLNAVGHEVTVFERSDRAGGLLMYGIPNMKIDKKIIGRRVSLMKESGIRFVLNTEIGHDLKAADLLEAYGAVLLCCGAGKLKDLDAEGSDLKGVYRAVDFLSSNTQRLLDTAFKDSSFISAKDKNVIIIGGGDTGTDCIGTVIRHGCKSVTQFQIHSRPSLTRQYSENPWPEWPDVLRSDYVHKEAISIFGKDPRQYCLSTKKLVGNAAGKVTEVHTVDIAWSRNPAGRSVRQEIAGSERVWKADLVLLAMGFCGPEDIVPDEFQLERDPKSNVNAEYGKFETNQDKVFAAGDMRRGQSLVVWAIQEGKLAAKAIDQYLTGKSVLR